MKNVFFKLKLAYVFFLGASFFFGADAFAGSAVLTWTANTEPDLAGYKVYYDTSSHAGTCPVGYPNVVTLVGTATTTTINGLTEGQTYYFQITAYDTSGNESTCSTNPGEVSKLITASSDLTAPTVPQSFTATAFSSSQINLSWQASTDNVAVSGYKIYRGGTQIATTSATTYNNTGLTASTQYSYEVSAYDAAGNESTKTASVATTTLTTSDSSAPTIPQSFTATAFSSSQINLAWQASTDNVAVSGYKVYRGGTQIATTTTTSYSNTGLTASTQYSYQVSAYDAAGNESVKATSTSATTQAAQAATGGNTPSATGGTTITVTNPTTPTASTTTATSTASTTPHFIAKPFTIKLTPQSNQINLTWNKPNHDDFQGILILRKEESAPTSRTDGQIIYTGNLNEFKDGVLDKNKHYYYAFYAYDKAGNYSESEVVVYHGEENIMTTVKQLDTDHDGLTDDLEKALGTDLNKKDTDGDGHDDKTELKGGFNPLGKGKLVIETKIVQANQGRILLQVQSKGEAWYINPADQKRYYLGRPADAFELMRKLGLGVKNSVVKNTTIYPARLQGKILINVEDKGKAYYINPKDKKAYYLGRPADAMEVMKKLGVGITNANLAKIGAKID